MAQAMRPFLRIQAGVHGIEEVSERSSASDIIVRERDQNMGAVILVSLIAWQNSESINSQPIRFQRKAAILVYNFAARSLSSASQCYWTLAYGLSKWKLDDVHHRVSTLNCRHVDVDT